ncbi:KAP family P-loop NTPase fold protein [Allorhizocola rhizosphaerae]|uniref:KAP family P-loop NTPase fold protein n=1 Tax=Allorhizocola rhizosphaerae TaxID=1872709 RepID=UPI000E3E6B98|nr:P-loop NTPase fold protein [Allorhizocola rhizosphaerae]
MSATVATDTTAEFKVNWVRENHTMAFFWRRRPRPIPAADETDTFSSDLALSDLDADEFGRASFAQRVAGVIQDRTASSAFVIGVYGPWGSGKTTALRFVETQLKAIDAERFPVVWFNPWRYGSEELLVQGLFDTLADTLATSLPSVRDKIGKWLQVAGGAAGGLTLSGHGAQAGIGTGLAAAGRLLSQRSLERDRDRLNDALRASGKRIVVMIDDIDRLDKDEIVSILRAVKLAADFHNLVYILAFDQVKVAAALADRYPGQSGSDFLDKMVQLPLSLPRVDPAIVRQRLLRDFELLLGRHGGPGLTPQGYWRLVSALDASVLPCVRTARDHTLYLNAVEFAVPAHHGELNVVDVVLLEALRMFYPAAFEMVSRGKEVILNHEASAGGREGVLRELLVSASEDHSGGPSTPALGLLQTLFPQFDAVLGTTYHDASDVEYWVHERRVCTDRYFDRFFTYGLPAGDVADSDIDELTNAPNPAELLGSLLRTAQPGIVIAKLLDRMVYIRSEFAAELAEAVADTAPQLPALTHGQDLASPRARASVLAVRLILRTAGPQRRQVAERLLLSPDFEFATLVLRWLRAASESTGGDPLLSAAEVAQLADIFADRLLDIDRSHAIIDSNSATAPEMYALMFQRDTDRASRQLSAATKDRHRLARLLRMFMPTLTSLASGRPVALTSAIEHEAFSRMLDVVPLASLLDGVSGLADPGENRTDDTLINRFIAYTDQIREKTDVSVALPVVRSESPHPLSNFQPAGALGGAEPHDADFVVRVAILTPGSATPPPVRESAVSRIIGHQRETELIKLVEAAPITPWLTAHMGAFGAAAVMPWTVTEIRGDDFTSLTSEIVDPNGNVAVRAKASITTGISDGPSPPRHSLLLILDVSFALLNRDAGRKHIATRNDTSPIPAPAALKIAELVNVVHAGFGIFETTWEAAQLLLPPVSPRAAIGVWLASRNGLDRVIDTSHLRVLGNISVSEERLYIYRQLAASTTIGEASVEQESTRDLAIAVVARMLNSLNRRGFEAELAALRSSPEPANLQGEPE